MDDKAKFRAENTNLKNQLEDIKDQVQAIEQLQAQVEKYKKEMRISNL